MILLKNILLEGKSDSFLKFYNEIEKGYNPEKSVIFDCLMTLKEYYDDYLRWYEKYPKSKEIDREVFPHFQKRLEEINIALQSDDIKRQVIAVDNGINQWHIDYPVVYHFWMGIKDPDNIEGVYEEEGWMKIRDVLLKLGKLLKKGPYKRNYE